MTAKNILEQLTDALDAPARPDELANQANVVSQMSAVVAPITPTGKPMIIKAILGHKVAALATAVVFGSTGVAAASTGSIPFLAQEEAPVATEIAEPEASDPVEIEDDTDVVVEADVVDAEVEEPTEDVEEDVPTNEDGEPYGDVDCDDAVNHGEYVSGVAKDETIEGNRGAVVSQAAKTDCGKSEKEDKPDKADKPGKGDDDHDDDDDSDDDDDEKSDKVDKDKGNKGNKGNSGR